ncbi:MAG: ABC transporter permease subunit [bacterium]
MFCIVQRETIGILRQRRSLFQLGIGLLILSCVFVVAWVGFKHDGAGFRPPDMGRRIFVPIVSLQLIFLFGLGRVTSGAISEERERETWDLLMTTPLGPWRILLGKLLSSLLFILLLYIALLPILALCFLLGGLSPRELIGTYTILGCTAVLVAMLGLFCSSFVRQGVNAARLTVLLLILYFFCLPFARILLASWIVIGRIQKPGVEILFSPVYSLTCLLMRDFSRDILAPVWIQTNPHIFFLLVTMPICFILFALVAFRVRVLESTMPVNASSKRRFWKPLASHVSQEGIADGKNPIWAKEKIVQNARRFDRPVVIRALLLIMGVVFATIICVVNRPPRLPDILVGSAIATFVVMCLTSISAPAASVAGEHDRKTWDLLRVSTLSSTSILSGKALAALENLFWLGVFFFTGICGGQLLAPSIGRMASVRGFTYKISDLWSFDQVYFLAYFLLLAVSTLVFYARAGIYFSARVKNSARAGSQTFGLVLLHTLGGIIFIPLVRIALYLMFRNTATDSWAQQKLPFFFVSLTPIGLLVEGAQKSGLPGEGWIVRVLIHSVVLFIISGFLFRAACRRIDRQEE